MGTVLNESNLPLSIKSLFYGLYFSHWYWSAMNMARIHFFPLGIFLNLVLAQLGQDFKKFTEWTQK
ncbi:hypothetical protein [uncultured Gammaproteobacteria bacterium]|nr:hypothetical protein [uncultured Gammaproteobacteria bacterium]